jgi:hypothetical protein
MAETETPFNPLDSLGPEYGSINPPNADEISYAPFEGDRIKMPEINFSASPIPSFSSLTQPQLNIKNTITGLPPGKPGSKTGQSTNDIASAFIDYSKSLAQANQDKILMLKYIPIMQVLQGITFIKDIVLMDKKSLMK